MAARLAFACRIAVLVAVLLLAAHAEDALWEVESGGLGTAAYERLLRRQSILQGGVQREIPGAAIVQKVVDTMRMEVDHHYFASPLARDAFEADLDGWLAAEEATRGPRPLPFPRTFRYFVSPEEQLEQEERAAPLHVVVDRRQLADGEEWLQWDWVAGGLLMNVDRPVMVHYDREAEDMTDNVIFVSAEPARLMAKVAQRAHSYAVAPHHFNTAVIDTSSGNCAVDHSWVADTRFSFKTEYCAGVFALHSNLFWLPPGLSSYAPFLPGSFVHSTGRSYYFAVYGHVQPSVEESLASLRQRYVTLPGIDRENLAMMHLQLRNCIFVLCPDTQPTCAYDSLQAGAIPITADRMMASSATAGLGRVPFPRLQTWQQVSDVLEYYAAYQEEVDAMQVRTVDWWGAYLDSLRFRANQLVDSHIGDFQLAYYEA